MNWVKDFYQKQYKWMDSTSEEKDHFELQVERIDTLKSYSNSTNQTILELGAGEGYFAIAAAQAGYNITVIELIPEAVNTIKHLVQKYKVKDKVTVIEGDFYEVKLDRKFDIIFYWDGFGIGEDEDQIRLLSRIKEWMQPSGVVMIDIYTPWYWAKANGERMKLPKIEREYGFNAFNCRMIDTWWPLNQEERKVTQSLRCYSPADLKLLLKEVDLQLITCEPGGSFDYDSWVYIKKAPLHQCMNYLATITL
ncbi:class I SAM-dependent methyltransferase [Halalkalibacillus sediminis]|uniref:Class I SAM-dependent methyltransferase n=1 Tax=Halalkalibacillus sediminis TaxID=2018042 RepID=A0A2I0QRL0_9BACI|nr:class I SAM-dependent methyltransferase [Halalkalibacillus sediminis]PKR76977.1 class I SAM-dependent methyltransferase [Halalkalibacillus sediminis]